MRVRECSGCADHLGGSELPACTDEAGAARRVEPELASSSFLHSLNHEEVEHHKVSFLSFSNHTPPFPFLHHPSIPCLPTAATSTSSPGFYAVGGVNFPTDRIPELLSAADPTVALLQLLPSSPFPAAFRTQRKPLTPTETPSRHSSLVLNSQAQ